MKRTMKKNYIMAYTLVLLSIVAIYSAIFLMSNSAKADTNDHSGEYLYIGGTEIINGGEFAGGGDSYNGDGFTVSRNEEEGRLLMEIDNNTTIGGIEIQGAILDIHPSDDTEGAVYNIKTCGTTCIDSENVDCSDYSVYVHGENGGVNFRTYCRETNAYLIRTWNLEGGIRGASPQMEAIAEINFNIGTPDNYANVGFENFIVTDEDLEGPESYRYEGWSESTENILFKGATFNIYAEVAFKDVGLVTVEDGTLNVHTTADDPVAGDTNTKVSVQYGGTFNGEGDNLADNLTYYNKYINTELDSYSIHNTEEENTEFVQVTESTDHVNLTTGDTSVKLESRDPGLSNFGWYDEELADGGGFEVMDGIGFSIVAWDENGPRTNEHTYLFAKGTEATIKVTPKYGHQFDTSLFMDEEQVEIETEAQDEVATYVMTVPTNNVHLAEMYMEVDNEVQSENASAVDGGTFILDEAENTEDISGSLEMVVEDVDTDTAEFEAELEDGYEIATVVDLTVHPEIYMGDSGDSWVEADITEFDNDIQIALVLDGELAESVTAGQSISVVREHEGTYETLEGEVVEYEGQLYAVFYSNQFSTYALAINPDEVVEAQEYTIESANGDSVTFTASNDLSNMELFFECVDITNPDAETLEGLGVDETTFNALLTAISEGVKNGGNEFLALYNMRLAAVIDGIWEDYPYEGPFTVKLNMLDTLKNLISEKGFNTFTAVEVYADDEGNLVYGDTVELTLDGDYLVGSFDHFGVWAIVGRYVEPVKEKSPVDASPSTGDGMNFALLILGSLLAAAVFMKITVLDKKER